MRFCTGKLLITLALTALASQVAGQDLARVPPASQIPPKLFVNPPGYYSLTVDLHTHSVFSDGHVWPTIRVEEALRDGLDAIAVTEHLEWQPRRADLPHPDRNRAYEKTLAAVPEGWDLIVIPGAEITREFTYPSGDAGPGHLNAVFIQDANQLVVARGAEQVTDATEYYIAANAWPPAKAVEAAMAQGAFIFWNHPYAARNFSRNAVPSLNRFHQQMLEAGQLHGIEIANGHTYSEEAHAIALENDLALIGVSDVHGLTAWDYPKSLPAHRPMTLVLAEEQSSGSVRNALFARRTLVWFRDLLIGREPALQAQVRACLDIRDVAWREDVELLEVTHVNDCALPMHMQNLSDHSFEQGGDHFRIPAHGTLKQTIRPLGRAAPGRVAELEIRVAVLNALTAPKTPLELSHKLDLSALETPGQDAGAL